MAQASEEARSRRFDPNANNQALLGSDRQPALFVRENGEEVQLGDVVSDAFRESGLTVQAWNEQSSEDRETAIQAIVDEQGLTEWTAKEDDTTDTGNAEEQTNEDGGESDDDFEDSEETDEGDTDNAGGEGSEQSEEPAEGDVTDEAPVNNGGL